MDRVRKGSGFTVISADDRVKRKYDGEKYWTDLNEVLTPQQLQRTEVLMGETVRLLHLTKRAEKYSIQDRLLHWNIISQQVMSEKTKEMHGCWCRQTDRRNATFRVHRKS